MILFQWDMSPPLTDHQGFHPTLDPGELGFDKLLDADVDKQQYQEAIVLLNYAAVHTCPDLSTTVSLLSGYTYRPSVQHMQAIFCVFQYLHSHQNLGIYYTATD
ncbi:hypothetical protein HK096_003714, partial [Nowakowskiella sp. JEL0078]